MRADDPLSFLSRDLGVQGGPGSSRGGSGGGSGSRLGDGGDVSRGLVGGGAEPRIGGACGDEAQGGALHRQLRPLAGSGSGAGHCMGGGRGGAAGVGVVGPWTCEDVETRLAGTPLSAGDLMPPVAPQPLPPVAPTAPPTVAPTHLPQWPQNSPRPSGRNKAGGSQPY